MSILPAVQYERGADEKVPQIYIGGVNRITEIKWRADVSAGDEDREATIETQGNNGYLDDAESDVPKDLRPQGNVNEHGY